MKQDFKKGFYHADIYFEVLDSSKLADDVKIEIFGEFSSKPWQHRQRLAYKPRHKLFSTRVKIRKDQQFKFILEDNMYLTSKLYHTKLDEYQ